LHELSLQKKIFYLFIFVVVAYPFAPFTKYKKIKK